MSCTKLAITKVLNTKLSGPTFAKTRKASYDNAKVLLQQPNVSKISPILEHNHMPKLRNISIPYRDSRYSYLSPDI